jgi:alpha-beta hydrolase superfamily lysophospholipase
VSVDTFWFGPADRSLFGHLHTPPDRRARGGIIICPPVGIEHSHTELTLRLLARKLEAAGFLVLRFDYDGTGQSVGDMSDEGRVAAWLASVRHAVALLQEAGAEWIGGIGLRLGATLIANIGMETRAFGALLLWEPYVSGTQFLREQRALQFGVLPPMQAASEGVATPGYVYSDDAAAGLRALAVPADAVLADRVLVLADPARPRSKQLTERLRAGVEWREYVVPCDIFDTGRLSWSPPLGVLDQVVTWLGGICNHEPAPVSPPVSIRDTALVGRCDDERAAVESVVQLGPVGLFGVRCDPSPPGDPAVPTVLFLSMAAESSIGPARQWVEISRRLACDGFSSVRLDLSGIGESPARPGQVERTLYAPHALRDIEDAARAVSPDDATNVALVGVCSGAYAALAAAPLIHPRATVSINPVLTGPGFVVRGATDGAWARRLIDRLRDLPVALAASVGSHGRGSKWRSDLADRLPVAAWRVIYALRLAQSPARLLTPVAKLNIPTLLICGEAEARVAKRRTPDALQRLAGVSKFEEVPTLNHSLLNASDRRVIGDLISDFLGALFRSGHAEAPARSQRRVRPHV